MKQCSNQACHTSLQRHRDDLALLNLSRIKSVICPKCEISRPSELAKGAAFCFPDHPKMTRPGFVLYHLRHLSQIWGNGRAQPPVTKALSLGRARLDPVGEAPVIGGPPTDTEPAFCGQCQDSSGTNVQQIAPRAQYDIFTQKMNLL